MQYLNSLVGSLRATLVSFLYKGQPLATGPNSNSNALAVDDAFKSLGMNRNSLCLLLSDAAK